MSAIDLTVSIVNWYTRDELLKCLASFIPDSAKNGQPGSAFLTEGLTIEVIVVDNASGDGSSDAVRQQFPVVQVLQQRSNLGFGKGHNKAFEAAEGRYLFILNPDSELKPGCLQQLVAFAESHPDAGIIGPRVENPNGTVQHSARQFPTLEAGIFRHTLLGRLFPQNKALRDYLQTEWDHNDAREVDWVSGAAMLIRADLIRQLSGLDEDYYMYVEDVDICWRARKAGWSVWFCPDAVVMHIKARSSDKLPNRMIYHHHRSMYLFFRKHYWKDASWLTRIAAPLGLLARGSLFIFRNKLRQWLTGKKTKDDPT